MESPDGVLDIKVVMGNRDYSRRAVTALWHLNGGECGRWPAPGLLGDIGDDAGA